MASNQRKPFSKRHGYSTPAPEISIREDAPENLRHFILETAVEFGIGPTALRDAACAVLHVRPDPNNWSPFPNIWTEVQELIYSCPWFRVYDFIERLYNRLNWIDEHDGQTKAAAFEERLNEFFIEEGIGWQIIEGQIVSRGAESFELAVNEAAEAVKAAGRDTAHGELYEARMDLSRRPKPDLTGAVQHAMAALECVCRDAVGDPRATLGDILKRNPELLPKPLDTAVEKAWGYASEMGRHVREGREPERKEVELIVGMAATVATYLSR